MPTAPANWCASSTRSPKWRSPAACWSSAPHDRSRAGKWTPTNFSAAKTPCWRSSTACGRSRHDHSLPGMRWARTLVCAHARALPSDRRPVGLLGNLRSLRRSACHAGARDRTAPGDRGGDRHRRRRSPAAAPQPDKDSKMAVVIESLGLVGQVVEAHGSDRGYVKAYDREANAGMGAVEFTLSLADALTFPNHDAAIEFVMSVPVRRPIRPDGRPNRPICAFNLELRTLP